MTEYFKDSLIFRTWLSPCRVTQRVQNFTDSDIEDNLHTDCIKNGIHENLHNVRVSKNGPLLWSRFTAIFYVRKSTLYLKIVRLSGLFRHGFGGGVSDLCWHGLGGHLKRPCWFEDLRCNCKGVHLRSKLKRVYISALRMPFFIFHHSACSGMALVAM